MKKELSDADLWNYFAGQALGGLICKFPAVQVDGGDDPIYKSIAAGAANYADAMMAEKARRGR